MRLSQLDSKDKTTSSVIIMPKAKPTQVIVHRIELQEKEREALEAVVGASVVKDVGQTLVMAGGIGAGSYLAYKALKQAYGWTEDIVQDIKNTPAQQGAEIFMDYTPTGQLIKGYRKFLNWAFQPQESN